jgi:hypothetical protein
MYDHFVHVERALESTPGLKTLRLDPSCYVTPSGTADFMRLTIGDFFHLQIFSAVLAHKMPDSPVRGLKVAPAPAAPAGAKGRIKTLSAAALRLLTPPGGGEILLGELGLNRSESFRRTCTRPRSSTSAAAD